MSLFPETMDAIISEFSERIRKAAAQRSGLRIRGSGTKDFFAHRLDGEVLDVAAYRGVIDYEPSELVLTARAGTPLSEVEQTLAGGGQMLACEPPYFGPNATLGGCVAAGFSGPRRVATGSVRDFVLGTRVLDGQGRDLRFGGQVMKNVAGFDVSRLMAGSFGTLGLILEVSMKVLPRPEAERTLRLEMPQAKAIETMNRWAGQPLPISATCHDDQALYVRLSGSAPTVDASRVPIGDDEVADAARFWTDLREQRLPSLQGTLWRLSIRSTSPTLALSGAQTVEWNGSLRWIATDDPAEEVHAAAAKAGGHATRFRGPSGQPLMQLSPGVMTINRRVKQALDPQGVFGPHRLHAGF
jgi:glycolate oxidase FAD binding subunit